MRLDNNDAVSSEKTPSFNLLSAWNTKFFKAHKAFDLTADSMDFAN